MIVLMQCVAEAVMSKGVRGLAELVPGGPYLYDVANDALKRMRERKRAADIRDEVLAAVGASIEEVKQRAAEIAKDVAAAGPVEDRLALEMYLTQIPGAIRQSLRRTDDPSGRTVPADFALSDPADLLRRLPQRVARFRPGDPLPGKTGWKLVEFLGSGGFGEVWLARNPTLTALHGAVKFGLDPVARDRLLRHEGALINRVMEQGRHPNVVQLLDAHIEGDAPWLMYEYVPGGDLGTLVLSWQALPAGERAERVVASLRMLASAVGQFHRLTPPLVHRDLKPANVLSAGADPRSPIPELKIADFGIGGVAAAASLASEATRRGSTGSFVSQLAGSFTPLYAGPQQQRGEPPDPRDDVHALGVIGYQMLTGKLDATLGADYAKTLRRLGVPEPLVELLGDCAAHDADNRPRDGDELLARLTALPSGVPARPTAPAPVPVPERKPPVAAAPPSRQPVPPAWGEAARQKAADPPAPRAAPVQESDQSRRAGGGAIAAIFGIPLVLCLALLIYMAAARTTGPGTPPKSGEKMTEAPPRKTAEFLRAIKTTGKVGTLRTSQDGRTLAALVTRTDRQPLVEVWKVGEPGSAWGIEVANPRQPDAFGFSPMGERMVLATTTGAKVVSVPSGTMLFNLDIPDEGPEPSWVSYSPDGKSVLVARDRVHVRDVDRLGVVQPPLADAAGKPLFVGRDSQFLFDPTGTYLAVARPGADTTVLFRADGWKYQCEIGSKDSGLVTFSRAGAEALTWDGKEVKRWSSETGEQRGRFAAADCGAPVQLLAAGGDRRIVCVGKTGATAFEFEEGGFGRKVGLGTDGGKVTRAAVNAPGTSLATVTDLGRIRVRSASDLGAAGDDATGHTGQIDDIQFTPDGNTLVAVGADGIFLWSVGSPGRR